MYRPPPGGGELNSFWAVQYRLLSHALECCASFMRRDITESALWISVVMTVASLVGPLSKYNNASLRESFGIDFVFRA
jgi:hypothetical protein